MATRTSLSLNVPPLSLRICLVPPLLLSVGSAYDIQHPSQRFGTTNSSSLIGDDQGGGTCLVGEEDELGNTEVY